MGSSAVKSGERRSALSGIKVLELGGIGPGQFGAMLVADHGADVVRIERPGNPFPNAPEVDLLNRGKRIVRLDLKRPEDLEKTLELAAEADVVIEGFRPGVAERLGIGPDVLRAANKRLVYARMTGWGQSGPLAQRSGHDINYIAVAGALNAFGRKGTAPTPPLNLVGDFAGGGLLLAFGISMALLEAQRTGEGQVIDSAMIDGVNLLMTAFFSPSLTLGPRGTNMLDTGQPLYDVYETADGLHMAVGALDPPTWRPLAEGLGLSEELVAVGHRDQARWDELRSAMATAFLARTRDVWTEIFEGIDGCVTPILSQVEAVAQAQAIERDAYVDVAGIVQPAVAPRFSQTPGRVRGLQMEADIDHCLEEWAGQGGEDLNADHEVFEEVTP